MPGIRNVARHTVRLYASSAAAPLFDRTACMSVALQVISPENLVGYMEQPKASNITKVFEDAYKSPLSIVILVSSTCACGPAQPSSAVCHQVVRGLASSWALCRFGEHGWQDVLGQRVGYRPCSSQGAPSASDTQDQLCCAVLWYVCRMTLSDCWSMWPSAHASATWCCR